MTTAAPDIPVQIADLAGGGSPDDAAADEALGVFIDAIKQHDPRIKRLWLEASGAAGTVIVPNHRELDLVPRRAAVPPTRGKRLAAGDRPHHRPLARRRAVADLTAPISYLLAPSS